MKNITLLIAMLFAFAAKAQESYPGKHPELLVGKQVKVITNMVEKYGYGNFYTDESMLKTYIEDPQKRATNYTDLLDKTFTVVSAGPVEMGHSKLQLKAANGETMYYNLNTKLAFNYPFEVIGGLTIPAEYYCEEITQSTFDNSTIYESNPALGVMLRREITPGKPDLSSITIFVFMEHNIKPQTTGTLILENNKTVVFNARMIAQHISAKLFKYQFSVIPSAKEIELLKNNKILGVKIGDKIAPIQGGNKTKNVFACLVTKK